MPGPGWMLSVRVKAFPVGGLGDRLPFAPLSAHSQAAAAPQRANPWLQSQAGTDADVQSFPGNPPLQRSPAMTATRKKWSAEVTEHSNAMDLEDHVFESEDARKIAGSLKRSAEHSHRRKAEPFQSAMSMLNFTSTAPARTCLRRAKKCLRTPRTNCAAPSDVTRMISGGRPYRARMTPSVLASSLRTALRAASGRCRRMFFSIASCSFCAWLRSSISRVV